MLLWTFLVFLCLQIKYSNLVTNTKSSVKLVYMHTNKVKLLILRSYKTPDEILLVTPSAGWNRKTTEI